jgi:hypothetical protein
MAMNLVASYLEEKRRVVNEGIAEWVEFNLYRSDPHMKGRRQGASLTRGEVGLASSRVP